MKTLSLTALWFALCFVPCVMSSTLEEEIPDNSLIVTFKDVDYEMWRDDGSSSTFRKIVANLTNTYCDQRPSDCSLQSYNANYSFTVNDVMTDPAYPMETMGNDLEVKFYVTIPDGSIVTEAGTDNVIAYATLQNMMLTNEVLIEESLAYTMMYVGDTLILPPIDHTMNIIMIPIACVLLLIIIIIAIGMHCYEKRRTEENQKARRAKRGKISPSHGDSEGGFVTKTGKANNGEPSLNKEEENKSDKTHRRKKEKKHSDQDSGEDNKGYEMTPRGNTTTHNEFNIKPNDQSTMKSGRDYDGNLDDKHGSKRYSDDDKWEKSDRHRSSKKHDDYYDSMEDTGRSSSRKHRKKKRKHRRHRDESSENDIDYRPSHLPPMEGPVKRHTTEI